MLHFVNIAVLFSLTWNLISSTSDWNHEFFLTSTWVWYFSPINTTGSEIFRVEAFIRNTKKNTWKYPQSTKKTTQNGFRGLLFDFCNKKSGGHLLYGRGVLRWYCFRPIFNMWHIAHFSLLSPLMVEYDKQLSALRQQVNTYKVCTKQTEVQMHKITWYRDLFHNELWSILRSVAESHTYVEMKLIKIDCIFLWKSV